MTHDDPRHGTYAGYQQHRKAGEPACGPCRSANADYTRSLRDDPHQARKERQANRARSAALWRLADAHREEYERLYADELLARRSRAG